jgi:hypothetical protein
VDTRAQISLTTNGVKLREWVDRLLEANVRHYAISIHAATPETHNDVMGMGPHSFEKVLTGVRYLASQKGSGSSIDLGMVFIVMRQNIAEIPQFIRLCEEIGANRIFFRTLKPLEEIQPGLDYHRLPPYLHPEFERLREAATVAIEKSSVEIDASPETWSTPVFPPALAAHVKDRPLTPRDQRGHLITKITRADDRTGLSFGEPDGTSHSGKKGKNIYHRRPPLRCPSPYTAFYINGFDRAVSPCCYMTKVPGHKTIYFQKSIDFDLVWNSPAMVNLRKTLHGGPLMDPCLKCPFYW